MKEVYLVVHFIGIDDYERYRFDSIETAEQVEKKIRKRFNEDEVDCWFEAVEEEHVFTSEDVNSVFDEVINKIL